ncbi:GTPase [Paraburkholderia sp. C35]|uniref:GTPase n=1 Tax=Paraburkholderia sp. C35 TaxID=2126993 RepID=UPI000D68BD48|nr:GTPase [Paraburkholderia sp. C35]
MNSQGHGNFDFAGKAKEEYEKIRRELKRPNILVCGGTGAGKSTLINLTLADEKLRAAVNAGRPVTQVVEKYQGELITVYDSPGYESGESSQKKYKETVLDLIFRNKNSTENRIHMAWYCISQGNDRVLDIDIQTINGIRKVDVPLAVVLTQADKGEQGGFEKLKALLEKECPDGVRVFETSQNPSLGLGVDPLLKWAMACLDESLRTAFISSSNVSIETKLEEGRNITLQHIGIAAGIAASPIPWSDAPLLLGNQATLMGRLASLWNLPSITSAISSVLPGQIVSTVGKSAAGNLIKMIPGVGSVAGALINAGVASAMTAGIGYGINELFAKMARDELAGKQQDLSAYLAMLPDLINMFKKQEEEHA